MNYQAIDRRLAIVLAVTGSVAAGALAAMWHLNQPTPWSAAVWPLMFAASQWRQVRR